MLAKSSERLRPIISASGSSSSGRARHNRTDHIVSFHGTLKREYIWPHGLANYQQAEAVIPEAFRDCSRNRPHSALKYVQPDEFVASCEAEHK